MKTRFGWAIGVNVAVACLLMQGCKATRVAKGPDYGNEVKTVETQPTAPAQTDDIKVSTAPEQTQAPAQEPKVEEAPAPEIKVTEAPAPAPAVEPEYTLYTVKPGDMLSKISRRYNIRQKAILDLNPGLQPNKLYAGRQIKLPGVVAVDAAPAPAPAVQAAPASSAASVKAPAAAKAAKYSGATKVYVVKNGDSLGKIAYGNGTNIRTLKEINGLKTDRVFIGQKLKVPAEKADAKAAAPAKKAAAKADAPAKKADAKAAEPAKKVEVPAAKDAEAKPAAEPAAPAAQPAAEPAAAAAAPAAAESQPAAEQAAAAPAAPAEPAPAAAAAALDTHVVKEGEDIVSIAISYGISPSALMDANNLKSSEVKPGDVLKIPAKSAQ